MKAHVFIILALACVWQMGCGAIHSTDSETKESGGSGTLRGIQAINTHIQAKILDPQVPENAEFRIEKLAGTQLEGMKIVAGYYAETGASNDYGGAELNPLGLAVWQRYLEEFAALLAQQCDTQNGEMKAMDTNVVFHLHTRVAASLTHLCQYHPESQADRDQALYLYRLLNGPLQPEEAALWLGYLDEMAKVEPNGQSFVTAAIYSAILSPEFLLEL